MTISTTFANPRVIFVQATEPSDKSAGKLWYDTVNGTVQVANGTSYAQIVDSEAIEIQQLEQDINILINSAAATSTLDPYTDMFLDIFTDSNGFSNTVDTGNTTAIFSTNKYTNGGASSNEDTGISVTGNSAQTGKFGEKISCTTSCNIISTTKEGTCTATKAYVYNSAHDTILGTADFSGNTATFSPSVAITSGNSYYMMYDADGASYNYVQDNAGVSYPITGTNINYTHGVGNTWTEDTGVINQVSRIVTQPSATDKIVQTNAITITANPVAYRVIAKTTESGTATNTYEMKIGSGSFQTGKEYGTKYANTDTGTTFTLKQKLNAGASNGTATASNYAVMLYY